MGIVEEVPGSDAHVVDERGGGEGGDQESAHGLRQRQRPDIPVAGKDFGENKSSQRGSNHQDRIGDMGGAKHQRHQE